MLNKLSSLPFAMSLRILGGISLIQAVAAVKNTHSLTSQKVCAVAGSESVQCERMTVPSSTGQ
jgi:hypothetical protein